MWGGSETLTLTPKKGYVRCDLCILGVDTRDAGVDPISPPLTLTTLGSKDGALAQKFGICEDICQYM